MQKLIEEKLAILKQEKEQHVANLNACVGAISILEDLLKPKPVEEKTKVKK